MTTNARPRGGFSDGRTAWNSARFLMVLVSIVTFLRWIVWGTAVLYLAGET